MLKVPTEFRAAVRVVVLAVALLVVAASIPLAEAGKGGEKDGSRGSPGGGKGGGGGPLGPTVCPDAATMDELVACLKARMPRGGSGTYVAPGAKEQAAWRTIATAMLTGSCLDISISKHLRGDVELRRLADAGLGTSFCVLVDARDDDKDGTSDLGWGAFITASSWNRELHLQAPHPLHDRTTPEEAAGIFQDAAARSLAIAGAHRYTLPKPAGGHSETDMAHQTGTMFQASLRAVLDIAGAAADVLQVHGMAATSCDGVDIYITGGEKAVPAPGSAVVRLRDAMREAHATWSITTYGDTPTCGLHGSTNAQGPDVRAAGAAFLHAEAAPGFRSPGDWSPAVVGAGLGQQ